MNKVKYFVETIAKDHIDTQVAHKAIVSTNQNGKTVKLKRYGVWKASEPQNEISIKIKEKQRLGTSEEEFLDSVYSQVEITKDEQSWKFDRSELFDLHLALTAFFQDEYKVNLIKERE